MGAILQICYLIQWSDLISSDRSRLTNLREPWVEMPSGAFSSYRFLPWQYDGTGDNETDSFAWEKYLTENIDESQRLKGGPGVLFEAAPAIAADRISTVSVVSRTMKRDPYQSASARRQSSAGFQTPALSTGDHTATDGRLRQRCRVPGFSTGMSNRHSRRRNRPFRCRPDCPASEGASQPDTTSSQAVNPAAAIIWWA